MRARRIWFWRPSWHWYGAATLWPIEIGGDEWHRRVVVFGWTVTGRVAIALWRFNPADCDPEACFPECPDCGRRFPAQVSGQLLCYDDCPGPRALGDASNEEQQR